MCQPNHHQEDFRMYKSYRRKMAIVVATAGLVAMPLAGNAFAENGGYHGHHGGATSDSGSDVNQKADTNVMIDQESKANSGQNDQTVTGTQSNSTDQNADSNANGGDAHVEACWPRKPTVTSAPPVARAARPVLPTRPVPPTIRAVATRWVPAPPAPATRCRERSARPRPTPRRTPPRPTRTMTPRRQPMPARA